MDGKIKRKLLLSLLANSAIVVCTAKSVLDFFSEGGEGNMTVTGTRAFRYYTVDSNVLAALAGCFMILCILRSLRRGSLYLPRLVTALKFAGTATVTITLLVVVFFLGPLMGYGLMFAGNNLYMHLTTPLLALASLLLWEAFPETAVSKRDALGSVIPTAVYGAVYFTQVLLRGEEKGGWPDFYHFNAGDRWYVALLAIAVLAFLLAGGLRRLQKKFTV